MQVQTKIRRIFKHDKLNQSNVDKCFQKLIHSFEKVSFVYGYDDCVRSYLKAVKRKKFTEREILAIVSSSEFRIAFNDIERYDIELTRRNSQLAEAVGYDSDAGTEDDLFDMIYTDNYVYMKDMVDSIIKYRGHSFYYVLGLEDLLCAEFSTMRQVGFVMHFIINFAYEYRSAWDALDDYTDAFESKKAKEFIRYLKVRVGYVE